MWWFARQVRMGEPHLRFKAQDTFVQRFGMTTSKQRYHTWKLPREVPGGFYIVEITYNFKVLQITVANDVTDETFLIIRFLFPVAHRVLNESYRLRSIRQLSSILLIAVVEESEFQTWVHDESLAAWKLDDLTHFVVCDSEWVVDILIEGEPELIWQDILR